MKEQTQDINKLFEYSLDYFVSNDDIQKILVKIDEYTAVNGKKNLPPRVQLNGYKRFSKYYERISSKNKVTYDIRTQLTVYQEVMLIYYNIYSGPVAIADSYEAGTKRNYGYELFQRYETVVQEYLMELQKLNILTENEIKQIYYYYFKNFNWMEPIS